MTIEARNYKYEHIYNINIYNSLIEVNMWLNAFEIGKIPFKPGETIVVEQALQTTLVHGHSHRLNNTIIKSMVIPDIHVS